MLILPDLNGRLRLSHADRHPEIREGDFFEATMHVLGVASGYRPGKFICGWEVDRKTGRSVLRDRVLRLVGINPDDPSTYPTNTKGRLYTLNQGRASLYDVLDWGPFYAQGHPWASQKYKNLSLVVKGRGPKGASPTGQAGPAGSWALTEAGVALAARVHRHYMRQPGQPRTKIHSDRNVTCVWLDAQIREHDLYNRLFDALSQMQQIKKEVAGGEIRDHINHWFGLAIKRDGLRTRLETYDPPTFRQLRDWVVNAIWTTLRSRAQDANARQTHGALTERERTSGAPATAAMTPSSFVRVIQKSDESDEISEDLVDSDAHARDQHTLDFKLGMKFLDKAFQTLHPGNAERLSRVFTAMATGATVPEMAEAECVSRNRMASILGAVRGALRDARLMSGDMQAALEFVQENPWATRDDLVEVVHEETNVDVLIALLVGEGRLSPQKFKHGVGYITTDHADAFLASRDATDAVSALLL